MAVTGLLSHIRHTRLIRRLVMVTAAVLLFSLFSRYVFLSAQQERHAQQLAVQRFEFLAELLAQQLDQSAPKPFDQQQSNPQQLALQPNEQPLQLMIDSYAVGLVNSQVVLFYPSGQPMLASSLQHHHRYLSEVAVWPDPPRSERHFVDQRLQAWQALPQGHWLYVSHVLSPAPISRWFWWYALGVPLLLAGVFLLVLVLPLSRLFDRLQQLTLFAQQIDQQTLYQQIEWRSSEYQVNGLLHALNRLSHRYLQKQQALTQSRGLQATLVEASPEILFQVDAQNRICYLNSRFEQEIGLPREHFLNQVLTDVLQPLEAGHQAILGRLSQVAQQVRMQVRCSGHRAVFDLWLNPIRHADGLLSGYTGILHNISDYHTQLEDIDAEMLLIHQQLFENQHILATMSHELRTPLNGILGMTQLLRETEMNQEQSDYLRTLYHSGQSMLRLVNDILDLAKLDAGKMQTESIEFDLLELTLDVSDLMLASAGQKAIEFVRFIHPSCPRFLQGDPHRIRQILLNLLGNAIKFTQSGYVGLLVDLVEPNEVVLREHASKPDLSPDVAWIRFQVIDTGVGIPQERQADLFQFFAQADQSVSRRFGGTGLGLAISRGLAEAMSGCIQLSSHEGQGTTFNLYLPLQVQNQTLVYQRPAALHGLRLLAFEPLPINQLGLQRLFGYFQIDCRVYADLSQMGAIVQAALAQQLKPMLLIEHQLLEDLSLRDWVGEPMIRACDWVLMSRQPRRSIPLRQLEGFQGFVLKPLRVEHLWAEALSLVNLAQESVLEDPEWVSQSDAEQSAMLSDFFASLPDEPPETAEKLHVLLAEDNIVNQKVASKMLQKLDCEVVVVENGREAVEYVAAHSEIHLVLMDCRMPEMDGLEATRRIRASRNSVPIIALTANDTEEDREACMQAGMDEFLAKPIDQARLGQLVRRFSALR
ncbi:MAG: response regulator [Moraxellaceae bacterium]